MSNENIIPIRGKNAVELVRFHPQYGAQDRSNVFGVSDLFGMSNNGFSPQRGSHRLSVPIGDFRASGAYNHRSPHVGPSRFQEIITLKNMDIDCP